MTTPTIVDATTALRLARDETGSANPKRLLQWILHYFGGYEGLAQELLLVYKSAQPGSNTQAIIMRDIMRLLVQCAEEQYDDGPMTLEEVDKELRLIAYEGGNGNGAHS